MKKNIIYIGLASVFLFIGCSKKTNQAPTTVDLVYPTQNLLCISQQVDFQWSASTDAENEDITYNIIVAKDRDLTDVSQDRTTSATNILLSLSIETAYYWRVTAIDAQGNESDASPVYAFYTKGNGVVNSVPFTAELVAPTSAASVAAGSLDLSWMGSDADTADTLTYDVYFGEDMNPPLAQSNLSSATYNVTVASGKTYYWKINTIDSNGAKSIGQTWMFAVD